MLVRFPLQGGVFLPYDHGLGFGHQLNKINQSRTCTHTHTTKTQKTNITNTPAFLSFFLFGNNLLFKEKYVDIGCGGLRLALSMKFPENCYSLFVAAAPFKSDVL